MAIAIVDYCKGNLRSVQKGFELAGCDAFITDNPEDFANADAIVLPGVGSFADARTFMVESGQTDVIRLLLQEGMPFLGICLGLQLLFERGCEGKTTEWQEGLGIFRGEVIRMSSVCPDATKVKIPHVGWNDVVYRKDSPLFKKIPDGSYFYFTHSYIARPLEETVIVSETQHAEKFCSAVERGNIFGVQFHPEKSSSLGMQVLANFVDIVYER